LKIRQTLRQRQSLATTRALYAHRADTASGSGRRYSSSFDHSLPTMKGDLYGFDVMLLQGIHVAYHIARRSQFLHEISEPIDIVPQHVGKEITMFCQYEISEIIQVHVVNRMATSALVPAFFIDHS